MDVRLATLDDIDTISNYDHHIKKEELETSIKLNRVHIASDNTTFIGWLRYNLFWDNTPFMNMLYILEEYQNQGYGSKLVEVWENEMYKLHYDTVMTSTASNEYAQHFYMKLGYQVIGGFTLNQNPYEIILSKNLEDMH
ncbi:MAG: GNAT family N-acetyltransferase [Erysipelotrichales bacterium]|nr:GNAT family N-acetyltransferase [Erysipelotrichales bacterium]